MDHNLFGPYLFPQRTAIRIKGEDYGSTLINPSVTSPSSSSSLTLPSVPSTSFRRKGSAARPRPYPSPNRLNNHPEKEELTMSSNGAAYGSWHHGSARSSNGRSHPSAERRSSDGEIQNAYAQSSQFMHVSSHCCPHRLVYLMCLCDRIHTWAQVPSAAPWAMHTSHTLDSQDLPPLHIAGVSMAATYLKITTPWLGRLNSHHQTS